MNTGYTSQSTSLQYYGVCSLSRLLIEKLDTANLLCVATGLMEDRCYTNFAICLIGHAANTNRLKA